MISLLLGACAGLGILTCLALLIEVFIDLYRELKEIKNGK